MLWGEHGRGGYNSENGGYIQGGEPMDEYFELIGIYMDFAEARTAGNWRSMRFAITSLRKLRADINISQVKEKAFRIEEEEYDTNDYRLPR